MLHSLAQRVAAGGRACSSSSCTRIAERSRGWPRSRGADRRDEAPPGRTSICCAPSAASSAASVLEPQRARREVADRLAVARGCGPGGRALSGGGTLRTAGVTTRLAGRRGVEGRRRDQRADGSGADRGHARRVTMSFTGRRRNGRRGPVRPGRRRTCLRRPGLWRPRGRPTRLATSRNHVLRVRATGPGSHSRAPRHGCAGPMPHCNQASPPDGKLRGRTKQWIAPVASVAP